MTKESRTLFLGILTLIVYAVSIFISQGALIFPFPLNEFIFLAIAAQFFWFNRNGKRWAGLLVLSAGVCAVLSTQFFWTFIYGQENMVDFMYGLTTDYFLIGFYGLILIGGVATTIQQRKGWPLFLGVAFIALFVSGVILNNVLLLLLGYACIVGSTQIKRAYAPYHLLWLLLFVLKLTEWLTFVLNN